VRRNGVTVTTEVVWVQHPLNEVLVHLREQPFALLIKEFEHEPWWTRAMFTSLDIQLLRETCIPLHLVHKASHALPRRGSSRRWTCPGPRISSKASTTRSSAKR
jgi:universal stress protein E